MMELMNSLLDPRRRMSLPEMLFQQKNQQEESTPDPCPPPTPVPVHPEETTDHVSDTDNGTADHVSGSSHHRRRHSSYEDHVHARRLACNNRVNNESYHVPATTKGDICSSNFSTLSLLMELEETTACPAATAGANTPWDSDVHFYPHDSSPATFVSPSSSSSIKQRLTKARIDISRDAERDRVKTRIACPHYRRWYYQQTHIAQPLRAADDLELVQAMVAAELWQQQSHHLSFAQLDITETDADQRTEEQQQSSCSNLFALPSMANPASRNSFHDHHHRMTTTRVQPNPYGVLVVELQPEEEQGSGEMHSSMRSNVNNHTKSNNNATNRSDAMGSLLSILHHVPQRPDITSLIVDTSRQTLSASSVLLILHAIMRCLSPDAAPRHWGSIEVRFVFDDSNNNYHKWYRTIQCSLSDLVDVAQLLDVALSLDIARWTITPYSGTYRYAIASRTTHMWQHYEQLQLEAEQEQAVEKKMPCDEEESTQATTCSTSATIPSDRLYDDSTRGSIATSSSDLDYQNHNNSMQERRRMAVDHDRDQEL